jgi:hypothetical protein
MKPGCVGQEVEKVTRFPQPPTVSNLSRRPAISDNEDAPSLVRISFSRARAQPSAVIVLLLVLDST